MSGYQPKLPKMKYRAIVVGDGTFIVEKYGPWYKYLIWGTRWYPVSNCLKDIKSCNEFVTREKFKEEGSKNKGRIAARYY